MTDKGMKLKQSATTNESQFIGSIEKKHTNSDGSVANFNVLWMPIIKSRRQVAMKDWTSKYDFARVKSCAAPHGHAMNETIMHSNDLKKIIIS